jgi:hypothetical protein
MKPALMLTSTLALAASALLTSAPAPAQTVYRCPNNEYTNQVKGRTDCQLIKELPPITILSTSGAAPARSSGTNTSSSLSSGANTAAQRARDADAKPILEQELRRAEAKQAELEKEYNDGKPERIGGEQNYQKYLDRVNEMKAALDRNKADIEGIKRELARFAPAPAPAQAATAVPATNP